MRQRVSVARRAWLVAFGCACNADPPAEDLAPPVAQAAPAASAEIALPQAAAPEVTAVESAPAAVTSVAPVVVASQAPDPDRASFARGVSAQPAPGPAPPGGFAQAAGACLKDSGCSIERYAALALAAADAAPGAIACFDLLRGVGVPVDLTRARSCLEAVVTREGSCGESSPSLERLELALLIATGRGGPRSSAEARKRLDRCFDDGSVAAVDAVIATLEKGKTPQLESVDVCAAELAQTTLHMSACLSQDVQQLTVRAFALEKILAKTFDDEMVARFRAASEAHAQYQVALAETAADVHRGGTMAQLDYPNAKRFVWTLRLRRWELFARGLLPAPPDVSQARAAVLKSRDQRRAQGDAIWRTHFGKMEKAYGAYRAKEATLWKTLPGAAASSVEAHLDAEWSEDLSLLASE